MSTRTHTAATEAMAERVRRSTGRPVQVENTGGGTMVAVAQDVSGLAVAFHSEGYAVYADMTAWHDGSDPIHQDSTRPLETVLAVIPWLTVPCHVCAAPAMYMAQDANSGTEWVAVCSTACEDAALAHAADCDCDDCADDRAYSVYVLIDGERSEHVDPATESEALAAFDRLAARPRGAVEFSVVALTPSGDILAETTIPTEH